MQEGEKRESHKAAKDAEALPELNLPSRSSKPKSKAKKAHQEEEKAEELVAAKTGEEKSIRTNLKLKLKERVEEAKRRATKKRDKRRVNQEPLGMETIAEVEGADDEDVNQQTAREHIEDVKRRSKSKAEKKSKSNNFVIDPSDLNASDDFDDMGASGKSVQIKPKGGSGAREAFQSKLKKMNRSYGVKEDE